MSTFDIFAGTWNLGGQGESCGGDLESWAKAARQESPACNLFVFGFQEVVEIKAESHLWYPSRVYLRVVEALDRGLGRNYNLIACHGLGQMFIAVFGDRAAQANIREAVKYDVACGRLNIIGNKGATIVKLTLTDEEELFLINSHLAAHKQNVAMRNENYHRIMAALKPHSKSGRRSIIWVGDLNYRLDLDNIAVRGVLSSESPDLQSLVKECQLRKAMAAKDAFDIFTEMPIDFMPTYKYDMGTNVYDTSRKQRVPGWTDRVLWTGFRTGLRNIQAMRYKAWSSFLTSDHRAVSVTLSMDAYLPSWDVPDGRSRAGTASQFSRSAALEFGPTPLLVRTGELLVVAIIGIMIYMNARS